MSIPPAPDLMPYDIPYGPTITADRAAEIAAAAVAEARKPPRNWKLAVAVVDPNGDLVYFYKMDDTQLGSIDIAINNRHLPPATQKVVCGSGANAARTARYQCHFRVHVPPVTICGGNDCRRVAHFQPRFQSAGPDLPSNRHCGGCISSIVNPSGSRI